MRESKRRVRMIAAQTAEPLLGKREDEEHDSQTKEELEKHLDVLLLVGVPLFALQQPNGGELVCFELRPRARVGVMFSWIGSSAGLENDGLMAGRLTEFCVTSAQVR